jgi:hypothetical protein
MLLIGLSGKSGFGDICQKSIVIHEQQEVVCGFSGV